MFQVRIHGHGGQGVVTAAELLSVAAFKQADAGRLVLERMELDDSGFPQPTGELEKLEQI